MSTLSPILVLGGARSGKSAFAERILLESKCAPTYLATATASDEEMLARIQRHRHDRGEAWETIEEPLDIVDALKRESEKGRGVLVDCLTLWLSNLFMEACPIDNEIDRLAAFLQAISAQGQIPSQQDRGGIVLVSAEIGLGLVPESKLGRDFRDAQGRLNQKVAAVVPTVIFVAAGLPLYLKGMP
jgi:adenosylcobinamide kinase/adenosylcobinamide-phosphate guanylyltransferase